MAASPYDLTSPSPLGAKRRRFTLPRLGAAGFGGGFGLLVIAIGLLVIGIGWNGMAGGGGQVNGASDLRAQLPWLVSGGILGLALVVFGAAMLIVHNARTDRARLEVKLDEVVAALSRGGAATSAPYPADPTSQPQAAGVFIAGASAYHVPSCRLVQGRDDVEMLTAGEAATRELKPCRVCKPAETIAR